MELNCVQVSQDFNINTPVPGRSHGLLKNTKELSKGSGKIYIRVQSFNTAQTVFSHDNHSLETTVWKSVEKKAIIEKSYMKTLHMKTVLCSYETKIELSEMLHLAKTLHCSSP